MALTTVNSDGVKDDSIKNIDVKSDAAIAGSKINPNFGDQAISGGKISLYDNGSTSPTVLIATDDGTPYALQIRNDSVSNADTSGLFFYQNTSTGAGNIRLHGATAYLPIAISQRKVDTNDTKTVLYIDASQNVGIGTDSPSGASGKTLEINGGSGQARFALKNDTTGSASTDGHQIYSDGLTFGIQNREAGNIVFETNGAPALTIDSSGRILIADAATAANTPMEVFGSAALQIATTAGGSIVLGRNDTSTTTDNNIGGIYWDCNDSTGNAWNDVARISCAADGGHADGDYPSRLTFHTTADGAATVSERLRITSGGKVLIGTDNTAGIHSQSGAAGLRVKSGTVGSNYSQGVISLMGSGGDFYAMTMRDSNDNGWGLLPLFSPTVDRFSIGYYDAEASPAVNKTIFTLNEQGHVIINDGNLEVANGHGIDFSASESSNTTDSSLLDDYEEGVYTPTVSCAGGGTYTVTTYTKLSYCKIGNLCHIEGYLNIAGITGTASGVLQISLPFTTANTTLVYDTAHIGISMRGHGDTLPNISGATDNNGVTHMEFVSVGADGTNEWLTGPNLNTSWNIRIGGSYKTA